MSTSTPKTSRLGRASLALPPGQFATLVAGLRRPGVMLRLALCGFAGLVVWAVTGAWVPLFSYRSGYTAPRDIVASIDFSVPDPQKTDERRKQRRSETLCIYAHDPQALKESQTALRNQVYRVIRAQTLEALEPGVWEAFLGKDVGTTPAESATAFENFKQALAQDMELARYSAAVAQALAPMEQNGLLEALEHQPIDGRQSVILVHPIGREQLTHPLNVDDVIIAKATANLKPRLSQELAQAEVPQEQLALVAQLTLNWLENQKFPTTLFLNKEATKAAYDEALASVEEAVFAYRPGDRLVSRGVPLTEADLQLLKREYRESIDRMTVGQKIGHTLSVFGMYAAMYVLCGVYIFYHERRVLSDFRRFATILGLVVVTLAISRMCARDAWRAELIPLILFGMTVTIAYQRELALLLSAVVALVFTLSLRQGLPEFVILTASVSAAILLIGRVRSRTKLIYVGLGAAAVACLTTIGIGTLTGQAYGASGNPILLPAIDAEPGQVVAFSLRLIVGAVWFGFCSLLAGLLMTGLLPFIERLFEVQTDLSLLEMGDAAHPLLQELARRAPGTYNHSINVASIAEAAAEAIGANGLLARVGAYFHDIGKMLKPHYYAENQSRDDNRHDSLVPAMSTLVIIAHVKDGADLARQHHLPPPIIDFIEQHHGTTLVEYFFREAARRNEENPDGSAVDETSFRYPGPKPLTREAGVMMLADAVESACRTLVEPAPARIDSLVREIAMKRLLDGQFDQCGLTLKELHTIEESLVKSLTAVYHGRVKYPDQQSA